MFTLIDPFSFSLSLLLPLLTLLTFIRVSALASTATARISKEDLTSCLKTMEDPAVLIVERSYLWLIGAPRYHYTCVYKGHRLHVRSFDPLDLPASVDIIRTRKL